MISLTSHFTILGFALGGPELLWIFLIALLLFGAKKLPELARGIGKSMGEFKKARDEFEREIRTAEVEETSEKRKMERSERVSEDRSGS